MLLMAFVAIAASAQDIFLMGTMNGWSARDEWKFTTTDNDTYILEGVDVSGSDEFKIAAANWSPEWTNSGSIAFDTPTTMNSSGGNMTLKQGGEGLTFTLVKSNNTLTVTNPSGNTEEPQALNIYFRGERNSWLNGNEWANRAKWKFTQSETNPDEYTLLLADVQGGRAFKIWMESDNGYYGGHTNLVYDTEYTLGKNQDPNLTLKQGGTNVLFTFNASTKVLVISNDEGDDPVEEVHEMYLVGDMNDWAQSDDWKFTKREGELTYILSGKDVTADQKFKIYCKTDDRELFNVEPIVLDKSYVLTTAGYDDHMHLAAGGTNLTFTVNKTNDRLTVSSKDLVEVEVPANGIYTIYFDNTDNWANVNVWIWDQNNDDRNYTGGVWPGRPMTFDEKSGLYTYSVRVEDEKPFMKVIFNDGTAAGSQTHNFVMYDNGIYNHLVFTDEYYEEEVVPVQPQAPATIYFNAGADLFDATKMNNNAPFIQAYNRTTRQFEQLGQMTLVDGRDAMFRFTIQHPENYQGVQFSAENQDGETIYWNGRTATAFDASNWTTFIYGTGNGTAVQSYMTFEELEDLRSGDKDNIYFIGDGIGQSTPWDQENLLSVNDVRDGEPRGTIQDGLYVRAFSRLDGNGGKFKMSSVNPVIYREAHNQTAETLRWWATFNLGIVGFIGDESQIQREIGEANGYVEYTVNEVEEYRNYNQYDWQFTFNENTVDEYYLVIDSYYHTTALIPFKPMPTLTNVTAGDFVKHNFNDDNDSGDYSKANSGKFLKGTATSGEARLSHYNSATGTAEIVVSPGVKENLWGNGYNVYYGLYNDGDLVTGFNGNKDADKYTLEIANMAAGEKAELSVRCIYTEKEETGGLKFRSIATSRTVNVNNVHIPALIVDENSVKSSLYSNDKGWNIAVSLDAEIDGDPGDLAVYPDFKVTNDAGCKVTLIDAEHEVLAHNMGFAASHTKYTSGAYVDATHNWATNIKNGDRYHFEFVIERVAPLGEDGRIKPESLKNKDIDFTIYASYPFLTDDNNAPTVTSWEKIEGTDDYKKIEQVTAARRRAGAVDAQAEDTNYDLTVMSEPTKHSVNTQNSGMSGISDAVADTDLNAEYFTLQGVRVEGELAPGIYLRRTGTTTSKVIIK